MNRNWIERGGVPPEISDDNTGGEIRGLFEGSGSNHVWTTDGETYHVLFGIDKKGLHTIDVIVEMEGGETHAGASGRTLTDVFRGIESVGTRKIIFTAIARIMESRS